MPRKRALRILLAALLIALPAGQANAAADSPARRAACAYSRMDLRAKIGQIFMVAVDGTGPTRHMATVIRAWHPGGIILFSRNVSDAASLRAMIAYLQHASRLLLLVATDQEGGQVARITVGLTPLPAPAYYGGLPTTRQLDLDTRAQGAGLKKLGINMNLAPVVDVLDSPSSAIGDRSFGPDPLLDARLVAVAIRGYQASGIAATAKHFLALGSVTENADLALPVVTASRATLEKRDLLPMRAAVKAGVLAMMATRVSIPALDPTGTAAYASTTMIQGTIRRELGFKGLIITDSLLSDAVLSGPGSTAAALAGLRAGDDMLLLGSGGPLDEPRVAAAIAAVGESVSLGHIPLARLDDAVRHVLTLKAALGLLPRC